MKKSDLVLKKNNEGEDIFVLQTDFMSKNHQGGSQGSNFETNGCICDRDQVQAVKL